MKKIILVLCLSILVFAMIGVVNAEIEGVPINSPPCQNPVINGIDADGCNIWQCPLTETSNPGYSWKECPTIETCIEGATKKYTCPDGTQVDWCTCSNGNFVCVNSPEIKCKTIACSMPICEGVYDTGRVDANGCKIYACPDPDNACSMPICEGVYDTGRVDANGCKIYACPDPDNACSMPICEGVYDTGRVDAKGCKIYACPIEEIKEQVKCLFVGSTQMQKCYTAEQNSRAYCSGTDACVADISGYKGERITWKSTCGGYAYTTIDGENEYAKFDCNNIGVCQPSKCDDGTMTECKIDNGQCICSTCPPIIIKPVCGNGICESGEGEICRITATTQVMCEAGKECYSPPADCFVVCPQDCKTRDVVYVNINEKFKLQVYQPAKIRDNGVDVLKITFRDLITSKCAETPISYEVSQTIASKVAVATTGTRDITATGSAIVQAETETSTGTTASTTGFESGTSTQLLTCAGSGPIAVLDVDTIVNGELGKHYTLNLNAKEKKQVGEFTVTFLDYDYASRSGVFLVSRGTSLCPEKCTCDEDGKIIDCAETCEIGKTLCPDGICRDECSIIVDDCKYGCSYDGKCFPMGVRSSGLFCGVDLNMNPQLSPESTCNNNFECSSNICVSGKCIDEGLIQKILNWFGKMFG